jgi:hypothetical protein
MLVATRWSHHAGKRHRPLAVPELGGREVRPALRTIIRPATTNWRYQVGSQADSAGSIPSPAPHAKSVAAVVVVRSFCTALKPPATPTAGRPGRACGLRPVPPRPLHQAKNPSSTPPAHRAWAMRTSARPSASFESSFAGQLPGGPWRSRPAMPALRLLQSRCSWSMVPSHCWRRSPWLSR